MRAVIAMAAVAAVTLVAGCGGDEQPSAATDTSGEASHRDPGREVADAFVAAAKAGDTETMWELLSAPSRRRYGPTQAEFASRTAPRLAKELAPFAGGKLPVEVSENVDGRFGLVALSRGADAWATPLRREGEFWRVELPGRLRIDISGPPPRSKGSFANQIGVEVRGRTAGGTGLLYLDGVTLDPKIYSSPTTATMYASFPNGVEQRRHTAVAFALSGNTAAATAWTFVP